MISFRFRGAFSSLSASDRRALLDRSTSTSGEVSAAVSAIIADVRERGDAALRDLSARYDRGVPDHLEVPRMARRRALEALDPDLRRAMERSATNIARVSESDRPRAVSVFPEPGVSIVRRPDPIGRVGLYAPGGRAAYPSSVLMAAVPARVAGVPEVLLCSPPGVDGLPSPLVLAAAELAGVDRVFAVGGAGAVAAMAFGTKSVPRVDRIVGPGNAYVAEAKLQVVGAVGIDAPAGPSELLVLVDEARSARIVAVELLAQAEHDPLASAVAVCVGGDVGIAVQRAIAEALPAQPRSALIADALAARGGVLTVSTLDEALSVANEYAPEHLLLAGRTDVLVDRVRNAGSVFVGNTSSVSFGDYMSGGNHVLPTGGLARSYSGLSVLDFFRWTTCQRIDRRAAGAMSASTSVLAAAEGLPGHAIAAREWSDA
jgi:histidinol dehydrogenase